MISLLLNLTFDCDIGHGGGNEKDSKDICILYSSEAIQPGR